MKKRKKKEKLVSLRSLTGRKYAAWEKAWKDNFCEPYIGKAYLDDNGEITATEILSKGIEYLVGRNNWFFKKDIEHYILTVNLLNGNYW